MDVMHYYGHVAPVLMVALVIIFGAIVAWAYWPKQKERFEKDGKIPLHDGD
ncbi:MAG TPA: cbb3-type cytochrome c oxidase subunit 3 [Alphaproteobacteria bacterium]|nr:cbb3-type cytochrome c oxidase subunit 3 [Alphaproteobacteria bacterium]